MAPARPYEDRILQELRALQEEALPKMLRLITLVREECFAPETREQQQIPPRKTSHARTRQLLATSTRNWAQDVMAERDDRL
jgi:hypothetical protein